MLRAVSPLLLVLMAAPLAAAQPAEEAPAPPAEPAPAAPPSQEAPPPEPEAPADPNAERLSNVETQVDAMTEPFYEMQSYVAGAKRLKFSGYVQGRYEWHDDADFGLDPANPAVRRGQNRFLVRRGRLKATYGGDYSQYVLQIDAIPEGVALRDAEATLVLNNENIPGTGIVPWEVRLTVGQFKVPFGFEILQSSSDRELPERATMIRRLFPGERDRGLRLQAAYDWLQLHAALINGVAFTGDANLYGSFDQSSWKDLIGRMGVDLDRVTGGVSAHWGHFYKTTAGRAASGMTPAVPSTYDRFDRLRLGADAQVFFDVPGVGGMALRGEVIVANDENISFGGGPEDACKDVKSFGWYATIVQNIGDHLGAAFRVDQFDANRDVAEGCSPKVVSDADIDRVTTLAGALYGYPSGNLRITLAYEHLIEQGANEKDNDIVTAQLQAKF